MHKSFILVLFLMAIAVTMAGCRFVSPSTSEQAELIKRGSFPSSAPAWVSGAGDSGASIGTGGAGIIPTVVVPPTAQASNYYQMESAVAENISANQEIKTSMIKEEEKILESPLDRIEKVCPGNETRVNEALTTIDRRERISKYESLLGSCPLAFDIKLWLASDYTKVGRYGDALALYKQVLTMDPANKHARDGIAEIETRMNAR